MFALDHHGKRHPTGLVHTRVSDLFNISKHPVLLAGQECPCWASFRFWPSFLITGLVHEGSRVGSKQGEEQPDLHILLCCVPYTVTAQGASFITLCRGLCQEVTLRQMTWDGSPSFPVRTLYVGLGSPLGYRCGPYGPLLMTVT